MSTYSSYSDKAPDLIPAGTLCPAIASVRGIKTSKNTGGRYLDLELTVDAGPYTRRKVFGLILDPGDAKNSAGGREMGQRAIIRIFEAAGVFQVGNLASYQAWDNASLEQIGQKIDGIKVALSVKIESSEGYADKNTIGDFLTPNPSSAVAAKWKKFAAQLLDPAWLAGKPPAPAAAPVQTAFAGFGGAAAPPAPAAPTGFGMPAASGTPPAAPPMGGFAQPAPATQLPPVDPNKPAAWLAQAQSKDDDIPF